MSTLWHDDDDDREPIVRASLLLAWVAAGIGLWGLIWWVVWR